MASVFEKFGGIRPMAAKLGDVPPSTVMSWHAKRKIPAWRHASILDAARRCEIDLASNELVNIAPDEQAPRAGRRADIADAAA